MKRSITAACVLCIGSLHAQKIGEFTSVEPTTNQNTVFSLQLPESHTFQLLKQRNALNPNEGDNYDFTGYIPKANAENKSRDGFVSVNHETTPGGVSIVDVSFDTDNNIWDVNSEKTVDFSGVVTTQRNCSGGVTSWGTVITSEESMTSDDLNNDSYHDIGWQVEIDVATGEIIDHDNDGEPDKLYAMGKMSHENVVVSIDGTVAYEGADMGSNGYVYKFVPTTPKKLNKGELYVLKLNGDIEEATGGTWELVPNNSPEECNNTVANAEGLQATNFNGVEDVEIGPNGLIYFTAKGTDRVYRFNDTGSNVSEFEIYIDNIDYTINHSGGSTEVTFENPDNLVFDNDGNLFIMQDGGNNFIWMTTPAHSKETPDLHIFANTPSGSESTGATMSPDGKFMFISIQHPNPWNLSPTIDASGTPVLFTEDAMLVIARKEVLGSEAVTSIKDLKSFNQNQLQVNPNPVDSKANVNFNAHIAGEASLILVDANGKLVAHKQMQITKGNNSWNLDMINNPTGIYALTVRLNGINYSTIIQKK